MPRGRRPPVRTNRGWRRSCRRARREWVGAAPRQIQTAALRGMIDTFVSDLIDTTRFNVERAGVEAGDVIVGIGGREFSDGSFEPLAKALLKEAGFDGVEPNSPSDLDPEEVLDASEPNQDQFGVLEPLDPQVRERDPVGHRRGPDQRVAALDVVVQEAEGLVSHAGVDPQRNLAQLNGHRVEVHGVHAVGQHIPLGRLHLILGWVLVPGD